MEKLIAKRAILFGCKIYAAGDTLPATDERMVSAWLAADSAEFADTEAATLEPEAAPEVEEPALAETAPLESLTKDELALLAEAKGIKLPRGAAKALIIDRLRGEGSAQ